MSPKVDGRAAVGTYPTEKYGIRSFHIDESEKENKELKYE